MTHGGVLHAVHRHARGYDAPDKMLNGAINLLHVEGGAWALETWNDTSHLRQQGLAAGRDAFGGGASGL